MNKYQEAFEVILWSDARKISNPRKHFKARDVIEQLVERATPKKCVVGKNYVGTYDECPMCHENTTSPIKHNYCHNCGQAIDWSKE